MKVVANRLAHKERERLFAALEKFVNLGEAVKEWEGFLLQCQGFDVFPIKDVEDCPINLHPWHKLALRYRDHLRAVWEGRDKDGEKLSILLGLKSPVIDGDAFPAPGPGVPNIGHVTVQNAPNWKTGGYTYEPQTEFQGSLYQLWKESWRARICACCAKFFIASKSPQLYCSVDCAGKAKKARALDWWRNHGADWRKGRAKGQGKKSHRKRG